MLLNDNIFLNPDYGAALSKKTKQRTGIFSVGFHAVSAHALLSLGDLWGRPNSFQI